MPKLILILILLLISPQQLIAETSFRLLALFPGKVMVEVHGKRFVLKKDVSRQGLKLIKSDPYRQLATIEVDGKIGEYEIGRHAGGQFAEVNNPEVMISKSLNGSYQTSGHINGQSVNFLVDTGASSIAMNSNEARRLGIDYKDGKLIQVSTASDVTDGYEVYVDTVSVGSIELRNIKTVVLEGSNPQIVLLGMSFLGQLEMKNTNDLLVLKKNF